MLHRLLIGLLSSSRPSAVRASSLSYPLMEAVFASERKHVSHKTAGKVEFSPLAVKVIYVLHVADGVEIRVGVKWLREQRVFGVGSRRGGSKDRGAMMLEEDALTININLIFRNRSVRYITDAGHPGEPQAEQSREFENLFLRRLRPNCILERLSRRIFFSMTLSGWSLQEFDCS